MAGWTYSSDVDKMTGKTMHMATSESSNEIVLMPPYGRIKARIFLRSSPRTGKSVIFMSDAGQIMCTSYDPCKITARFDAKPAQRFGASSPSDGSHEAVFIRDYTGFVRSLAAAKKLLIEVEYFRNGSQQFEFDVASLKTTEFLPPKSVTKKTSLPKPETEPERQAVSLARGYGCLTCHSITAPGAAPSFKDISARYKTDEKGADQIPKKIRLGTTGSWGGASTCPPHPSMSTEDSIELYVWITMSN